MNPTLSKAIGLLRFPLAALIVLKHYYRPDIAAKTLDGGIALYRIYRMVILSSHSTSPCKSLYVGYSFQHCTLRRNGY